MFTHLHLHTEYSLLDGLIKIKPLIKKVKSMGMTSVAMTDHGVMYGIYDFWSACKAEGIKPIIGCEVYLAARTRHDKDSTLDRKRYHLTLLAKNLTGYHNLIKICSIGHLEGFYSKPRVDREILQKYSEGIIVTTGCLASPVNQNLHKGNKEEAYEWAKFLKETFTDCYAEIQRNGVAEAEAIIPDIIQLAKDLDIPIVATCDSHYLEKGDADVQEVNWCIRDANLLADPNRAKRWSDEFYVKSSEEMLELFKDIPEAVENTMKIADMVEFYSIKYDRVQPLFPDIPEGSSSKIMLYERSLIGCCVKYQGTNDRFGKFVCDEWIDCSVKRYHLDQTGEKYLAKFNELFTYTRDDNNNEIISFKVRKDIFERINMELTIIDNKGYNDYFLVVSDFLNWAKNQNILTGVRGSVGGAVTAYVTGISDIDPIRWELYFERFLNPERPSPPDIDSDLQDDRREEVLEYVRNKYGHDNCSLILALGRLKTKNAIRDVARVMGIDLKTADRLSKMVIVKFGKPYKIKQMMEEVSEFADLINSDSKLQELAKIVGKIEDMPRQSGVHACGVLITPHPVAEYAPLQKDKEDRVVCQLEMKPIEELGLMKFDFLGLANYTIINNTLSLVEKYHNTKINIWEIDWEDSKTFDLLQKGDTDAVFQLESEGMKKYLRELHPTTVDDICFMCAAYRPGPMQFITPYINRKHGKEKTEFLIPELEPIVGSTYGFAIYQEQVLRIATDIAGYSLGKADILRRALGKKVKEILEAEKVTFVDGCLNRGFSEEIANKLYEYMLPFADYGFNKSHSAQYACLAYQTAYLKAHYPIEFLAANMQTDLGDPDSLKRDLQMAQDLDIKLLSPNINYSNLYFDIEKSDDGRRNIRYGLGAIKGLGKKIIEILVAERDSNGKFKDLDDLVYRCKSENITKSGLEILARAGCMDEFGNRNQLIQAIPTIIQKYTFKVTKVDENQMSMFDLLPEDVSNVGIQYSHTMLPIVPDLEIGEKIHDENNLLGTFFSRHPLTDIIPYIDNKKFFDLDYAKNNLIDSKVRVIAILQSYKKILTKKDAKAMAFGKISNLSANSEIVIFPGSFEKILQTGPLADGLKIGEMYVFEGKLTKKDEEGLSIVIDQISLFDPNKVQELFDMTKELKPSSTSTQGASKGNKFANKTQPNKEAAKSTPIIPEIIEPMFDSEILLDISAINDPIELSNIKKVLTNFSGGKTRVVIKMLNGGNAVNKTLRDGLNMDNEHLQEKLKKYIKEFKKI